MVVKLLQREVSLVEVFRRSQTREVNVDHAALCYQSEHHRHHGTPAAQGTLVCSSNHLHTAVLARLRLDPAAHSAIAAPLAARIASVAFNLYDVLEISYLCSVPDHYHLLGIHSSTHRSSQLIAPLSYPLSSQDGSSTLYPLAGCAQHGNCTSTST